MGAHAPGKQGGRKPFTAASVLALLALVVAVVASSFLATSAVYSTLTCEMSNCWVTRQTLAEVNGDRAYVILMIPVILAALGMVAVHGRLPSALRWLVWAGLLTFAFLGSASIGFAYLPAVLLLLVAVVLSSRQRSVAR